MSKYRIATQSLGNRERIELQERDKNGAWGMLKGYSMTAEPVSKEKARAERRKSVFALLGIATAIYALPAHAVRVEDDLIDYITD